jgi:hypothetical protein
MNDLPPLIAHDRIELRFFVGEVESSLGPASSSSIMESRIMQEYRNHYEYIQRIVEDTTMLLIHRACSEMAKAGKDLLDLMWKSEGKKGGNLRQVFRGMLPCPILRDHLGPILKAGVASLKRMNGHIVRDLMKRADKGGEVVKTSCFCTPAFEMRLQYGTKEAEGAQQLEAPMVFTILWKVKLAIKEWKKNQLKQPEPEYVWLVVLSGARLWEKPADISNNGNERVGSELPSLQVTFPTNRELSELFSAVTLTDAATPTAEIDSRSVIGLSVDNGTSVFSCAECDSQVPLTGLRWLEQKEKRVSVATQHEEATSIAGFPDVVSTNASAALDHSVPSAT